VDDSTLPLPAQNASAPPSHGYPRVHEFFLVEFYDYTMTIVMEDAFSLRKWQKDSDEHGEEGSLVKK